MDGVFGDSTGAAVLAFQTEHGLVADGAGPLTLLALVETLGASAETDAATAEQTIAYAEAEGRLSPQSAARYRKMPADSLAGLQASPRPGRHLGPRVPQRRGSRGVQRAPCPHALHDARQQRVLPGENAPSPEKPDILNADGVVYRFFPEHGFQFHPIAEFARLNKLAARKKTDEVRRLAQARRTRNPRGRALIWEYYFPFGGPVCLVLRLRAGGGRPGARAERGAARGSHSRRRLAAYLGIRRISSSYSRGTVVREYGFTDMAILNAQLQSLVSLYDYVRITGDEAARKTIERMALATRTLLPQFDTGCWSRPSSTAHPPRSTTTPTTSAS